MTVRPAARHTRAPTIRSLGHRRCRSRSNRRPADALAIDRPQAGRGSLPGVSLDQRGRDGDRHGDVNHDVCPPILLLHSVWLTVYALGLFELRVCRMIAGNCTAPRLKPRAERILRCTPVLRLSLSIFLFCICSLFWRIQ